MKISEAISLLETIQKQYGDLTVFVSDSEYDAVAADHCLVREDDHEKWIAILE